MTAILIIGAGISGLTLAQACRKQNIPCCLFERDTSAAHRSAGWGLTLNWSLPTFKSLLPADIVERLPETYVNKAAVDAGERGNFTFFDLSTGEAKWNVPASERIRVSRERLRKLMLHGLNVEWGKMVTGIEQHDNGDIEANFSDGSTAIGSFLVACDGTHSVIRKTMHPDSFENIQLPIRFLGAGVHYSEAQIGEIKKLDPYFLQGSDPKTNVFLWFSFLNTPSDPAFGERSEQQIDEKGGEAEGTYYCQIMTSWPYRAGFLGRADPTEIPNTKTGQLSWMKHLASEWAEPFKSIVQNIPHESEVMPVHLADWLPRRMNGFGGRVILVGDSAHTMVMYRGEGANHAIVDVAKLLEQLQPLLMKDSLEDVEVKAAVEKYEIEMVERTELAVLASRQACLDAHEWSRLNDRSPLVRRRLMKADLELDPK
jgi:2-polyprenyl-6-methoxyphenol hydroxylase-like FAD-dependent oxidoreductase